MKNNILILYMKYLVTAWDINCLINVYNTLRCGAHQAALLKLDINCMPLSFYVAYIPALDINYILINLY